MNAKQIQFTQKWSELQDENKYLESEELVLRNTYINSKTTPNAVFMGALEQVTHNTKTSKLKWADTHANLPLATVSSNVLDQQICQQFP